MSFIKADRTQQDLIGYRISDFVQSDAKSRFIAEIISRLDLSELFQRYSEQGGDAFAPDMMLALWFYAYSQSQTSSRKIEELCHYDMRYIYLSCNLRPDHTTLSRFRKSHLDLLSEYFVQIILIAEQEGLTDLKHITIDGTKIQAVASSKQSYKEDQLNKRIETIRKDISEYMQRCSFIEQGADEEQDLTTLQEEIERMQALEKKLIERRTQLQERKKGLKKESRENHKINIVEPEARNMQQVNGPGYNSQIAVDSQNHIIVANDVSDQPHDRYAFKQMHQKTEENLPADQHRGYSADAGYHSLDQLEYIDENDIDAVIADQKPHHRSSNNKAAPLESIQAEKRKVERCDFVYHKQEDHYECPAKDKLLPVSKEKRYTVYQARACQDCAIAHYCLSGKQKLKRINRDHREELAERMSQKLKSTDAKKRMRTRATTVEPVFGNIKHNLGFSRFNLRGLTQVKGEFNLMCIAHNLNTLFRLLTTKRLTAFIYASKSELLQHIVISKNIIAIFFNSLFQSFIQVDTR